MINSHRSNPFAGISTQAGGASGASQRHFSGGHATAGSGDGLDTFRAELQQGSIAANLSQPMPSEGQGQRLFAIG